VVAPRDTILNGIVTRAHISGSKPTPMSFKFFSPRGVGQSVTECVVKPLCDVKVTGSKPAGTKNPTMLRVGVAQAGCDPRVILTA
jgi:hypothetical protein